MPVSNEPMPSVRRRLTLCFLFAILAFSAPAAEQFGHVFVSPQSPVPGITHHGYRELRVLVENRSAQDTSRVTLSFPERAYGRGNFISRVSRTVVVGPGARAVVPLWQPPLPAGGNGRLNVVVDGRQAGSLSFPNTPQHIASGYYGGNGAAVLISRSLNLDEVGRALKQSAGTASHSAMAAIGAPNSAGSYGTIGTAWTPDPSHSGPHWIELDFDPGLAADRVRIQETATLSGGNLVLVGASGTNLFRRAIPSPVRTGRISVCDISFPLTSEPVRTVRLEFPGASYVGNISIDAVEISGPTGATWATAARASSEGTSAYGGGQDTLELLRSEVPVSEWSEHWLSYTPFDAVIASSADLKAMAPATAEALWRYAEAGGTLLLMGGDESHLPEPWRNAARMSVLRGSQPAAVGFGKCFLFPEAVDRFEVNAVKVAVAAMQESARTWNARMLEEAANTAFPVTDNIRIPVRGTVFAMLTFVLLIGPVNLIILARKKRRTWMLWTVPAISLVTCLLVFAYTFIREGVISDVRIEGLTLLDQASRRATSLGITAFYCPLTPSGGLVFSPETEVTPLVSTEWNASGSRREVDWTSAQHLEPGWVTARVPAHFELRKSETRRERLQVETVDGRLTVLNGLGATVRSLWLADASGNIYAATNIPAGQKALLEPFAEFPRVQEQPEFPSRPVSGFAQAHVRNLTFPNPGSMLRSGTYVAELDGNPFLENGLARRADSSRIKAYGVVYGILEP